MSIVNVFVSIFVSCLIPVENETRTHSLTSHTLETGASTVANYSFVVPLKVDSVYRTVGFQSVTILYQTFSLVHHGLVLFTRQTNPSNFVSLNSVANFMTVAKLVLAVKTRCLCLMVLFTPNQRVVC